MHRALKIPEVVRLIVEQLLDDYEPDEKTAFAALRSCKAFFDAGISLLWRNRTLVEIISLSNVLMDWNNEDHTQLRQFTITGRRERFHLYTSSIHKISWNARNLSAHSVQNLRLLTPPTAPYIFSNLRSLDALVVDPEDYQAVSTLICPSLRTLTVHEIGGVLIRPAPSVEDEKRYVVPVGCLLDAIAEVSTNLRSLSLGTGDRLSHAHTSALAKTFQRLTKLKHLYHDIRTWSDDWMECLAECPQLTHIEAVIHPGGLIISNPALQFSKLYALRLRSYSKLPTEAFFHMMPSLQDLDVTAFRMSEQSKFKPKEVLSMCTGISHCTQLVFLRVCLATPPLCDAQALWTAFSPVSKCALLRSCNIGCLAGPEFDPEDVHIDKLTKGMPRLCVLNISCSTKRPEDGLPATRGLTAATLRHLAENCPVIASISVRELNFNELVPPTAILRRETRVQLFMNHVSCDNPPVTAAFLTALWPRIDLEMVDYLGRPLANPSALVDCLTAIQSARVMEDMKTMGETEAKEVLKELMG